jgi:hypothetical protein
VRHMGSEEVRRLMIRYWRNEVPEIARLHVEKVLKFGTAAKYIQDKSFIFIHVPKCAGSSVSNALYGRKVPHFTGVNYKKVYPEHFKSSFTFAFVRHPVDRLISCYKFLRTMGTSDVKVHKGYKYAQFGEKGFDVFVDYIFKEGFSTQDIVLQPQSSFLCDHTGEVLVDEIFKYEIISEELSRLAKLLGRDLHLPAVNKSMSAGRIDLSLETLNKIYRLYESDFSLFGYDLSGY